MDKRKLVRYVALMALMCFVLALAVEYADAAAAAKATGKAAGKGGDSSLAQKKGVAGSLGSKKTDESKKATPLQMGIGIGSIVVAIAVIKWL